MTGTASHRPKSFAPEDRPHPLLPFFAFRIMVGIGLLMIAVGLSARPVAAPGASFRAAGSCAACLGSPLGFVAVLAGWFTAEVGRQPWVVYGLLRTADAVSPVPGGSVLFSLALFVLVYGWCSAPGSTTSPSSCSRGPARPPVRRRRCAAARPMAAAGNP